MGKRIFLCLFFGLIATIVFGNKDFMNLKYTYSFCSLGDSLYSMPRFHGCEHLKGYEKEKLDCSRVKFLEYLHKVVKYPNLARENGVEGAAIVEFTVTKEGYIQNAKVIRDPGAGLGEALLDAVNSMNDLKERWKPGIKNGEAVDTQFTVPLKFQLKKKK